MDQKDLVLAHMHLNHSNTVVLYPMLLTLVSACLVHDIVESSLTIRLKIETMEATCDSDVENIL